MNQLDLFDELTFIDDDLILEAHETPARHRFGGLRRAAVLIAAAMAVVLMSLTAVGGDWEITPITLHEKYAVDENYSYLWHGLGKCYGTSSDNTMIDGVEYHIDYSHVCTTTRAQTYTVCEGENLAVKLEATILMSDDRVEYKSVTSEGEGMVQLELDSMVGQETGLLVCVRSTVSVQAVMGRNAVQSYHVAEQYLHYLPTALGFQIPNGVDVRFPDTKFNYDGRAEPLH